MPQSQGEKYLDNERKLVNLMLRFRKSTDAALKEGVTPQLISGRKPADCRGHPPRAQIRTPADPRRLS